MTQATRLDTGGLESGAPGFCQKPLDPLPGAAARRLLKGRGHRAQGEEAPRPTSAPTPTPRCAEQSPGMSLFIRHTNESPAWTRCGSGDRVTGNSSARGYVNGLAAGGWGVGGRGRCAATCAASLPPLLSLLRAPTSQIGLCRWCGLQAPCRPSAGRSGGPFGYPKCRCRGIVKGWPDSVLGTRAVVLWLRLGGQERAACDI